MDYIRDHCKSTAFDVIKSRCFKSLINPYVTPEEVLQDLNNMFGEFDPYGTADATLHDPDFKMKKNETFDEFLTRYTSIIAPLQLREQQQISHLTRTITPRLRWHTISTKPTSFQTYVQLLRQCDLNIRLADKEHKRYHETHTAGHTDHNDGYSTDQSGRSLGSKRGYHGANQHSEEVLEQLRLEGKCFRCRQPGHMAMDLDAPCRGRNAR